MTGLTGLSGGPSPAMSLGYAFTLHINREAGNPEWSGMERNWK